MSIYRVHFTWKEKQALVKCRSLDLTHPYFVSMKDLVFTKDSTLIINPAEDDIRREFQDADHIMIPFQTVSLIEEILDETIKKRGATSSGKTGESHSTIDFPGTS